MDALIDLYGKTAVSVPRPGFEEENDFIPFSTIKCSASDEVPQHDENPKGDLKSLASAVKEHPKDRGSLTCLVTLQLTPIKQQHCLNVSSANYRGILELFGLAEYVKFAQSTVTTFDIVPRYDGKNHQRGFFASKFVYNSMGLYVIHDKVDNRTLGIIWTRPRGIEMGNFVTSEDNLMPSGAEIFSSLQALAPQPGFLLLCGVMVSNIYHDRRRALLNGYVSQVESRTKYQGWDLTEYGTAEGSFSELSASMSGLANSMVSSKRTCVISSDVLSAIEGGSVSSAGVTVEHGPSAAIFRTHIAVIRRRVFVTDLNLKYLEERARNQVTALLHLSNRQEMGVGIGVARDSHKIALSSKRDSTSMKTLAGVTIVFLPGTFVASMFSMTMFDWHATGSDILTGQFWIYWVVTIPLTMLTICMWYFWVHYRAAWIRLQDREADKYLSDMVV